MENESQSLTFCISCRRNVSPYSFSSKAYTDLYEYGKEPSDYIGKEGVISYRCECSPNELLAPNQEGTGSVCPNCGSVMNLFVSYCGVCAHPLKAK